MSTKMMSVPAENVEKAIEGARSLISNLQKIQQSRLIVVDVEAVDTKDDIAEALTRRVESGERLEDVVAEVENSIIVKLYERGHDSSAKLAKVLCINPDNLRQKLYTRGIKLKEVKKMLSGEGIVVQT